MAGPLQGWHVFKTKYHTPIQQNPSIASWGIDLVENISASKKSAPEFEPVEPAVVRNPHPQDKKKNKKTKNYLSYSNPTKPECPLLLELSNPANIFIHLTVGLTQFMDSTVLLILCYMSIHVVTSLDTLTRSHFLKDPKTLSSNDGMLQLGFFTPTNSTFSYLGIWTYVQSPCHTHMGC